MTWKMFYSNGSEDFTITGQAPVLARKCQTQVGVTDSNNTIAYYDMGLSL
jgi:hypothetical protein